MFFALTCLCLALLTGCARDEGSKSSQTQGAKLKVSEPTPSAKGANVLFIIVDTLRADHLGSYGRDPSITPGMDELAARGTRFARCSAAASTTLSSITSALTGTYPRTHGVFRNGVHWPKHVVGLQTVFKGAGYFTTGIVSTAALNPKIGFAEGFDRWVGSNGVARLEGPRHPALLLRLSAPL
jgi:arylsulfatase A-like enzyme